MTGPAVRQRGPAPRLDRAADLERELVEPHFPGRRVEPSLLREPREPAVRADIVEAVIVNADVRQVRRHAVHRPLTRKVEELGLTSRVELQHRRAELKPLRPLGPAARLVPSRDREDRRTAIRRPCRFERTDLSSRELEHAINRRKKVFG